MFDFGKLIDWIRGGLLEPHPTWEAYKEANHGWQATAMQLTLPLVITYGLFTLLFSGLGFKGFLFSVLFSFIWLGVGSLIASFFAGKFGGDDNFDQAWAALTFAGIPGFVGGIFGVLPWVGWLLSIAGAIWSLILLWQSLPVFLNVSMERRTGHFFATLGVGFVVMLIAVSIMSMIGLRSMQNDYAGSDIFDDRRDAISNSNRSSDNRAADRDSANGVVGSSDNDGSFLGLGRELDYLEEAGNDVYSPPADGKLTKDQVERTVKSLAAAQRLREASTKRLEKLGDDNAEPSFGDFMQGMKGLVSAGSAEMQAVKGGGGNWAEHEWVKRALFEAQIQQDSNDTTAHNYELYQQYAEELDGWL